VPSQWDSAQWQAANAANGDALTSRAVAAMAASLALPAMTTESAAQLAEAEGLVTHLTSLILIDEAATQEASIPATRKVELPTPRTAGMPVMLRRARGALSVGYMRAGSPPAAVPAAAPEPVRAARRPLQSSLGHDGERAATSKPRRDRFNAGDLVDAIDWNQAPDRLQTGDLADLDPAVAQAIRDLASRMEVIDLARKLALDPLLLVIGLLALMQADRNRSAARISSAIFGKRSRREIDEAAMAAGL